MKAMSFTRPSDGCGRECASVFVQSFCSGVYVYIYIYINELGSVHKVILWL